MILELNTSNLASTLETVMSLIIAFLPLALVFTM